MITSRRELPGRKTALTFTTTAERNEAAAIARAAGQTITYAGMTGLVTVRPTFRETYPTLARVMFHASLALLTCYGNLAYLAARYAYRRALPHYRAWNATRERADTPTDTGTDAPWWAQPNREPWVPAQAAQSTHTGPQASRGAQGTYAALGAAHSNGARFTVTGDGTVYGYRGH